MKTNDVYAEAVEWMHKIQALLERLGRGHEFLADANEVRVRHKPKRSLMRLFDDAGW